MPLRAVLGLLLLSCLVAPARAQAVDEDAAARAVVRLFTLLPILAVGVCWLLYLAFYNSRLLGFVLTRALRWQLGLKDQGVYVSVGACWVSILGGLIAFKNVRLVTKDMSIEVYDGHVLFAYWIRKFRRRPEAEDTRQCRLTLQLNGLAVHAYNKSSAYDALQRLLDSISGDNNNTNATSSGRSSPSQSSASDVFTASTSSPDESVDGRSASHGGGPRMPTWMKLFPSTRIRISVARYVVGNKTVPAILHCYFRRANLVLGFTERPALTPPLEHDLDPYYYVLAGKITKMRVRLIANASFDPEIYPLPIYSQVQFQESKKKKRKPKEDSVRINEIDLTYVQAVAGLVPTGGNPIDATPPQWSLNAAIKGTELIFATNMNHHRYFIQQFFFPWSYDDRRETPQAQPGEERLFESFELKLRFTGQVKAFVPFTDSPFGSERSTEFLFVNSSNCDVDYTLPLVIESDGYTSTMQLKLHGPEVFADTTLPFNRLMDSCDSLRVSYSMHVPIKWNQASVADLQVDADHLTLYFVKMHVPFFTKLAGSFAVPPNDWSRADFVPTQYNVRVDTVNLNLLMCVNRNNLLETFANHTEKRRVPPLERSWNNDFLNASCSNLRLTTALHFMSFDMPVSKTLYDVSLHSVRLQLIPSTINTLSSAKNLEQAACWQLKEGRIRAATFYHANQRNPALQDRVSVDIDLTSLSGPLAGFFVYRLLSWHRNYFGVHTNMITVMNSQESGMHFYKHAVVPLVPPSEPRTGFALLLDLDIHDIALELPSKLYSVGTNAPALRADSFHLGLYNAEAKMDLEIATAPISIHFERGSLHVGRSLVNGYLLYGPPDADGFRVTYSRHVKVDVGAVTGFASPVEYELLGQFSSCFVYTWRDYDNYIPPPTDVRESADPVAADVAPAPRRANSAGVPPESPAHTGSPVESEGARAERRSNSPVVPPSPRLSLFRRSNQNSPHHSPHPSPLLASKFARGLRSMSNAFIQPLDDEDDLDLHPDFEEAFATGQEIGAAELEHGLAKEPTPPPYNTFEFGLASVQVYVMAGTNAAFQLVAESGLEVSRDSLIRSTSATLTVVRAPKLLVQQFLCPSDDHIASETLFPAGEDSFGMSPQDWREVGVLRTALCAKLRSHSDHWKAAARRQKRFLVTQDRQYSRLPFLYMRGNGEGQSSMHRRLSAPRRSRSSEARVPRESIQCCVSDGYDFAIPEAFQRLAALDNAPQHLHSALPVVDRAPGVSSCLLQPSRSSRRLPVYHLDAVSERSEVESLRSGAARANAMEMAEYEEGTASSRTQSTPPRSSAEAAGTSSPDDTAPPGSFLLLNGHPGHAPGGRQPGSSSSLFKAHLSSVAEVGAEDAAEDTMEPARGAAGAPGGTAGASTAGASTAGPSSGRTSDSDAPGPLSEAMLARLDEASRIELTDLDALEGLDSLSSLQDEDEAGGSTWRRGTDNDHSTHADSSGSTSSSSGQSSYGDGLETLDPSPPATTAARAAGPAPAPVPARAVGSRKSMDDDDDDFTTASEESFASAVSSNSSLSSTSSSQLIDSDLDLDLDDIKPYVPPPLPLVSRLTSTEDADSAPRRSSPLARCFSAELSDDDDDRGQPDDDADAEYEGADEGGNEYDSEVGNASAAGAYGGPDGSLLSASDRKASRPSLGDIGRDLFVTAGDTFAYAATRPSPSVEDSVGFHSVDDGVERPSRPGSALAAGRFAVAMQVRHPSLELANNSGLGPGGPFSRRSSLEHAQTPERVYVSTHDAPRLTERDDDASSQSSAMGRQVPRPYRTLRSTASFSDFIPAYDLRERRVSQTPTAAGIISHSVPTFTTKLMIGALPELRDFDPSDDDTSSEEEEEEEEARTDPPNPRAHPPLQRHDATMHDLPAADAPATGESAAPGAPAGKKYQSTLLVESTEAVEVLATPLGVQTVTHLVEELLQHGPHSTDNPDFEHILDHLQMGFMATLPAPDSALHKTESGSRTVVRFPIINVRLLQQSSTSFNDGGFNFGGVCLGLLRAQHINVHVAQVTKVVPREAALYSQQTARVQRVVIESNYRVKVRSVHLQVSTTEALVRLEDAIPKHRFFMNFCEDDEHDFTSVLGQSKLERIDLRARSKLVPPEPKASGRPQEEHLQSTFRFSIAGVSGVSTVGVFPVTASAALAWVQVLQHLADTYAQLHNQHAVDQLLLLGAIIKGVSTDGTIPHVSQKRRVNPRFVVGHAFGDKNWTLLVRYRELLFDSPPGPWATLRKTRSELEPGAGPTKELFVAHVVDLPQWYVTGSFDDTMVALRYLAADSGLNADAADIHRCGTVAVSAPSLDVCVMDKGRAFKLDYDNALTVDGVNCEARVDFRPVRDGVDEALTCVEVVFDCSEVTYKVTPHFVAILRGANQAKDVIGHVQTQLLQSRTSSRSSSPQKALERAFIFTPPNVPVSAIPTSPMQQPRPARASSVPAFNADTLAGTVRSSRRGSGQQGIEARHSQSSLRGRSGSFSSAFKGLSTKRTSSKSRLHPGGAGVGGGPSFSRTMTIGRPQSLPPAPPRAMGMAGSKPRGAGPRRGYLWQRQQLAPRLELFGVARVALLNLLTSTSRADATIRVKPLDVVVTLEHKFPKPRPEGPLLYTPPVESPANSLSASVLLGQAQVEVRQPKRQARKQAHRGARGSSDFFRLKITSFDAQLVLAHAVHSVLARWQSFVLHMPNSLAYMHSLARRWASAAEQSDQASPGPGPFPRKAPRTLPVDKLSVTILLRNITVKLNPLPSLKAAMTSDLLTISCLRLGRGRTQLNIAIGDRLQKLVLHNLAPQARNTSQFSTVLPRIHIIGEYMDEPVADSSAAPTTAHAADGPGEPATPTATERGGVEAQRRRTMDVQAVVELIRVQLTTETVNHLTFAQSRFLSEVNELLRPFAPSSGKGQGRRPSKGGKLAKAGVLQFNGRVKLEGIHVSAAADNGTTAYFDSRVFTVQAFNRLNADSHIVHAKATLHPVLWFGSMDHGLLPDDIEQDTGMAYFKTTLDVSADHALEGYCDTSGQALKMKTVARLLVLSPTSYIPPAAIQKGIAFGLELKHAYAVWEKQQSAQGRAFRSNAKQIISHINQTLPASARQHVGEGTFVQIELHGFVGRMPLLQRRRAGGAGPATDFLIAGIQNISVTLNAGKGSIGRFTNLSARFETFRDATDETFPALPLDAKANVALAPGGTVKVYSRMRSQVGAKKIMTVAVHFNMEGLSFRADTQIGRYLSALTRTMGHVSDQIAIIQPFSEGEFTQEISQQLLLLDHLRNTGADRGMILLAEKQLRTLQQSRKLAAFPPHADGLGARDGPAPRKPLDGFGKQVSSALPAPTSEFDFDLDFIMDISKGVIALQADRHDGQQTRPSADSDFGFDPFVEEEDDDDGAGFARLFSQVESPSAANETSLQIPQLSVRLNYHSKLATRAALYAVVSMSAPLGRAGEEALVLTPAILDFLLDVAREKRRDGPDLRAAEAPADDGPKEGGAYELPIDLSVKFHMESSQITLSSNKEGPKANLDCEVVLPAIDLVLSSLDADGGGARRRGGSNGRGGTGRPTKVTSVTAYLSRLGVVVQHPYSRGRGSAPAIELGINNVKVSLSRLAVKGVLQQTSTAVMDVGNITLAYDTGQLQDLLMFKKLWFNRKRLIKYLFGTSIEEAPAADELDVSGSEDDSFLSSDSDSEAPYGGRGYFATPAPLLEVPEEPEGAGGGVGGAGGGGGGGGGAGNEAEARVLYSVRLRKMLVAIDLGVLVGTANLTTENVMVRGLTMLRTPRQTVVQGVIESVRLSDASNSRRGSTITIDLTAEDLKAGASTVNYENEAFEDGVSLLAARTRVGSIRCKVREYNPLILVAALSGLEASLVDRWRPPLDDFDEESVVVRCSCSYDRVQLLVSRDTVPALLRINKRVFAMIHEQRRQFEQKQNEQRSASGGAARRDTGGDGGGRAQQTLAVIPEGTFVVQGNTLLVGLFRNSFLDHRWVVVRAVEVAGNFEQVCGPENPEAMSQRLYARFGYVEGSDPLAPKLSVEQVSKGRSQPTLTKTMSVAEWCDGALGAGTKVTTILTAPSLEMTSVHDVNLSLNVVYPKLDTTFADSLGISLDGSLYLYLREVFTAFTQQGKGKVASASGNAAPELIFLCGDHPGHGPWCPFKLNPSLRPLAIGNVEIPDIDVLLRVLRVEGEPHGVISGALHQYLHDPLHTVLLALTKNVTFHAARPSDLRDP